ncbi:hypothetical protein GCM10010334_74750 [Streptomyces finlayi]|uniref:Uncharacterized protein n=1 Tax=Streptomyces finlayi TaxID=67296 RepID=A0A918X6W1_9ACTN|nr:hypothetical protein GCM10010334_74750 [Streptomyces finlayi]
MNAWHGETTHRFPDGGAGRQRRSERQDLSGFGRGRRGIRSAMTAAEGSQGTGRLVTAFLNLFLFLVLVVAAVIFVIHKVRGRK